MPKAGNHWFATYHIYYKEKLRIIESIYDPWLLYKFGPFGIVEMQTDDILILANNNFASKKEVAIKVAKIIKKDWEHLTSIQPLKFNRTQIKLDSENIVLIKKSYVSDILLVTDYDIDSISSRGVTRKKLLLKE